MMTRNDTLKLDYLRFRKQVLTNKIIQYMNLLENNEYLFQNHDPLPHDFKSRYDTNDDL